MADDRRDYWLILHTLLLEGGIFAVYGMLRGFHAPRWTALVAFLIALPIIFLYGKVMLSRIDRDTDVAAQKRARQQTLAMEERAVRQAARRRQRERRMKITYEPEDDVLMIHFSDAPSVKTVSQGWNINVSYTVAGDIAEIEILDAQKIGLYPVAIQAAVSE